jgi:hypothetical protein
VYLNPRKSSPTIRDPRQFELTLEDLRRRAGIGCTGCRSPYMAEGQTARSASLSGEPGRLAAMLRSIERIAAL